MPPNFGAEYVVMWPAPMAQRPNLGSQPRRPTGRALRLFKNWFWRPPRPHGDTIVDRRVSPLELLYDLVYVAVISQAGLDLAEQVSLARLVNFAVVFSLTWIAWTNGSMYLELHWRSDCRNR